AAGVDIFKISVSADGTVTLTQYAEIDHLPEDLDGVNDNANLALGAGKVLLSATVTVIDGDNDSVETPLSVDLGDSISFDDDLPSVTAGDVNISSLALVTQDADTIGDNSDMDSESFEAAFLAAAASSYGADGPGGTAVGGYGLSVANASSGLTSNGVPIGLELDGG